MATDFQAVIESKLGIFPVKYVGSKPELIGMTALGIWENRKIFKVQVDKQSHPWAYGWHETERHEWRHKTLP